MFTKKKRVSRASRIDRSLPFSQTQEQIYDEYQRSEDALNLESLSLDSITNMAGTFDQFEAFAEYDGSEPTPQECSLGSEGLL